MSDPVKSFIDPRNIPEKDLPLVVLSNDSSGLFAFLIRRKTKSQYNHIMIMHKKDTFASQGNTFSEVDLSRYMKKNNRLKFWSLKDLTRNQRKMINAAIDKDLGLPWFKTKYDFLGILGQLINIRWINNTWTSYCSERVAKHLTMAGYRYMPKHPTPEELDQLFQNKKDSFEEYGYWWSG